MIWEQTLSRMQAVTVRGGWAYDISFEISNLNDTSLFNISQDRNTGECNSSATQMTFISSDFNPRNNHLP